MRLAELEQPLDGGDAAEWGNLEKDRQAERGFIERREAGSEMAGISEEVAAVLGVGATEVEHQVRGDVPEAAAGLDIFGDDGIGVFGMRPCPAIGLDQVDAEGHR